MGSLSLELCLVPELEEQECVHLPERGGRRCLELHGDSGKVWWGRILAMEERDVNERVVEVADQERGHNEEEEQWIWRNGLLVRVKSRIEVLTKKVDSFNSSIEKTSNTNSPYLKDMMDLNTELTGYFSSLTDNVNIRDLFDFLSICFYEYEHFFKEFRSEIYLKVLILEIKYPIFIIIFPQGGRADRSPPSCLRHRVQRHQEDLGVHQQQHDQLYCLNEICHSSCIMY